MTKSFAVVVVSLFFLSCELPVSRNAFRSNSYSEQGPVTPLSFEKGSWPYFLQHLSTSPGTVVDYRGQVVPNANKAFALVNYDVGKKDLQ